MTFLILFFFLDIYYSFNYYNIQLRIHLVNNLLCVFSFTFH